MINSVRNTVLAIANKNNYGYISPQDFNLYAKQAQMDMFEDYFYQYNNWINREKQLTSNTGYADIVKGLEEVIDSFSSTQVLINNGANLFSLPSNYYLINKLSYYPTLLTSSTTTTVGAFTLTDTTATFITSGLVAVGQLVGSTSSTSINAGQSAYIISVDSETQLTLTADIFNTGTQGDSYSITSSANIVEVERVNQNKIFYLNASPLTSPSAGYPAYVLGNATPTGLGNLVNIYPTTINTAGNVYAQYIRYPLPPKWTFITTSGLDPIFNDSIADYQDFELPLSDEPYIVAKICQYIGVEIREADVYQFGTAQENSNDRQTS